MVRTRLEAGDLRAAWEQNAAAFVAWARKPGHDSYWQFHRDLFLELLPLPGRRTLDLGCGEGRLSRDLKALGHAVVGIDQSPTMLAAANEADADIETHLADAASLPFGDEEFDLVVAFMCFQDVDDYRGAIREAARASSSPEGVSASRSCIHSVPPVSSRTANPTVRSWCAARTSSRPTTRTTSRETGSRSRS
jgi:ubiquinone/menaquinone biosynthesis C-methylase UbiE